MQGDQRRAVPEPRPGDSRRLTGPGEAPDPETAPEGSPGPRPETGGKARRGAERPRATA